VEVEVATDVQDVILNRISQIFAETQQLATIERLTLAKLLLESVLADEADADADWSAMGLAAFQRDWDNREDAVYDEWKQSEWLQAAASNPAFRSPGDPKEDIYSPTDGKPTEEPRG
jgi:hypothetical protein